MMKKILIKLCVIAAILLAADRLSVYLFERFIFSKTLSGESGGSVNYLIQKKKDAGLIIMGSSRAKHHIDPAKLTLAPADRIYNAGINGTGGLIYNNRLLHMLLEKGIHPKTIILQLDAFPYFTMDDEHAMVELAQLYPFIAQSPSLQAYMANHGGYAEKIKLFFHSYRFNGKLLNILYNFKKRHGLVENNGFEGLPGTLKDSVVHPLPGDAVKPGAFPPLKIAALEDFAVTCRRENIRLIVVFPPSYHNGLFTEAGTRALMDIFSKKGVKDILDLSDASRLPVLQQAVYWRDATHLNQSGAGIFTDSLNAILTRQ